MAEEESIDLDDIAEKAEGFEDEDSVEPEQKGLDVDFLNDVPMTVTVELGVGNITIKDLLQLGQGSVLELNKLAGEPLEVKVNDRLVSKGEVVVLNEKYGVRLTDVINPDDKVD
jgi:flagellar motor switch protein FliN/FliY